MTLTPTPTSRPTSRPTAAHSRLALGLALALLPACVLDRSGQSASEQYRRELALQGSRVGNLEGQFDKVDARVAQLEELSRARGQEEIQRMETLDEVRGEVGRIRGDLEVLRHEYQQTSTDSYSRGEDSTFRLTWLEMRAEAVEKSLGVKPPPPPTREATSGTPAAAGTAGAAGTATTPATPAKATDPASDTGQNVTDPDAMLKLAEEHLAEGREKAAIAVLDRFIKQFPDNKRVPEAHYRRAEAEFNAKNYPAAVLRFQEVIDKYRSSPWSSWAMLRQGECFEAQGQKDNARLFYEDVVRLWPKSKAAKEAKTHLGK